MSDPIAICTRAQAALQAVGISAGVKLDESGYVIRWVRNGARYEKHVPLNNLVFWRSVAVIMNEWRTEVKTTSVFMSTHPHHRQTNPPYPMRN